ncbi:hypothetical protein DW219_07065 [Desulfovibrio sp. AM18-2]|nr:hypothetical protein DW219_07065 [Desulfovibrio sp. AM18-2]
MGEDRQEITDVFCPCCNPPIVIGYRLSISAGIKGHHGFNNDIYGIQRACLLVQEFSYMRQRQPEFIRKVLCSGGRANALWRFMLPPVPEIQTDLDKFFFIGEKPDQGSQQAAS